MGALAAASPLVLDWPSVEGCPTADTVAARVDELVGGAPSEKVRLRAEVHLFESAEGWDAELTLVTAEARSHRRLEAPSCTALGDAVAVILALALDRAPILRTPITKAVGEDVVLRSRVSWEVSAQVVTGAGLLPGWSSGVTLLARWRFRRGLGIGLGASAWLPTTAETELAFARVGLLAGEVAIGQALSVGAVELRPEVRVEIGRLDVQGRTTRSSPRSAAALHVAVGAGLEGAVPLTGPLWACGRVGAYLAGARPEVVVEGVGRLYRPALGSVRIALGFELRFGEPPRRF